MNEHFCPYCMTRAPEGESCPVCGRAAEDYRPLPHHLPPGMVLMDRYLLGRVLGEGPFGCTYIGRDLRLELKVAVKEYFPADRAARSAAVSAELTVFPGACAIGFERCRQRFLEEARSLAGRDRQQVLVNVRDFFEANNTAYMVTEYVEGITLKELVARKGGRIAPEELFPMAEPLFGALAALHREGRYGSDLASPEELMVENGRLRMPAFSWKWTIVCPEDDPGYAKSVLPFCPPYFSLERMRKRDIGPWTDVYALCTTLYYCLTGKEAPLAIDRIDEDTLLPPAKLGVHLTDEEERALMKGLSLWHRRRFQSMEELHAALYGAPVWERKGRS